MYYLLSMCGEIYREDVKLVQFTWVTMTLTNSSSIVAASTQSCWAGSSAWLSISDCRTSSKCNCRCHIIRQLWQGWWRRWFTRRANYSLFLLQCDWPSSAAAEQPGLHTPEASECAWSAAPVELQSPDTWCWSTHKTKNGLWGCLVARQEINDRNLFWTKVRHSIFNTKYSNRLKS